MCVHTGLRATKDEGWLVSVFMELSSCGEEVWRLASIGCAEHTEDPGYHRETRGGPIT